MDQQSGPDSACSAPICSTSTSTVRGGCTAQACSSWRAHSLTLACGFSLWLLGFWVPGASILTERKRGEGREVEGGRENARMTSPSERSTVGRSRMRTKAPVLSLVFVTVIWCLVLFVQGCTGRTCPALLREVSPCGYSDQARSGDLYHICTGF